MIYIRETKGQYLERRAISALGTQGQKQLHELIDEDRQNKKRR